MISLLSPPCPSAIFWEKETKGSRSGDWGGGFSLTPLASPHTPYSPAQRDAAHTRKDYLKDDLFYFSLTFPSLGKWKKKKKDKIDHKRPKKKNQQTPT